MIQSVINYKGWQPAMIESTGCEEYNIVHNILLKKT